MRFPRSSGVLLHITSLPGPHGSGDFGPAAYHFVDWLQAAGQSLWQILPLGGIGLGNSPYMSSSAFAGNVLLIDLADLHRHGWLDEEDLAPDAAFGAPAVSYEVMIPFRMARLEKAASRFAASATPDDRAACDAFCVAQADWLEDYALFMALSEATSGVSWCDWAPALASRDAVALRDARAHHAGRVAFWKFCQWCFFRQWSQLRAYANARGVRMVGDAPIFIAHHSAEVWARPDLFELDAAGHPTVVAGVPPDDFSDTGQRWGNPLYRWSAHASEGFRWWIDRIRRMFEHVDVARIDHFRGFESYWEVPASEETALNGRWVKAPGDALFSAITAALGPLPIIAEDLGVITARVDALRKTHGFPGMRVLQFAWSEVGEARSAYLPHRHAPDTVVYGGTHDNNTTLGWWQDIGEGMRNHVREYLASDGLDIAWDFIRVANASVADLAIHPMQDILRLDAQHRMNVPGLPSGNWTWRFNWTQVAPWHAERLRHMCSLYGRLPGQHYPEWQEEDPC